MPIIYRKEKQHIEEGADSRLPNRKKLVIIAVGDIPLPSHAAFDFIHCKVGMQRKVMWKHFDVMVLIVPASESAVFRYIHVAKMRLFFIYICCIYHIYIDQNVMVMELI